jgi:hypothetical protein
VLHRLLTGLSRLLGRFDVWLRGAICNLDPGAAEAELPRWEKLLGAHPPPGATLEERRRHAGAWMFVLVIRAKSIPELDPIAEALIREGLRGSVVVHFEWK